METVVINEEITGVKLVFDFSCSVQEKDTRIGNDKLDKTVIICLFSKCQETNRIHRDPGKA